MNTGASIPLVMSCSLDGRWAAVGGSDGDIGIWDLEKAKRTAVLHASSSLCGVKFSADGRRIAAGYADGRTIIWRPADGVAERTIPATNGASVGALAFSDDGRLLVTGNQQGDAWSGTWPMARGPRHF